MSRRSRTYDTENRSAWPVTVRILAPGEGVASLAYDTDRWLMMELGRGEYARTTRRTVLGYVTEYHFRQLKVAAAFRERFPLLELADETTSPLWRSPDHPNGRIQG